MKTTAKVKVDSMEKDQDKRYDLGETDLENLKIHKTLEINNAATGPL